MNPIKQGHETRTSGPLPAISTKMRGNPKHRGATRSIHQIFGARQGMLSTAEVVGFVQVDIDLYIPKQPISFIWAANVW